MDTSDSGVARDAEYQLGWINWAANKGLVKPETAQHYRSMVESGAVRGQDISWIKLDGERH